MNGVVTFLSQIAEQMLDVILPPRERSARTREKKAEDFSISPVSHPLLGTTITTLMDYRDHDVQNLIQALKYDRSSHAARIAARLLEDYLLEEISSHQHFSQKKVLLVPLPLHESRKKERGFNQIELVLNALSPDFKDGTKALLAPQILVRIRATKPQTRLLRAERLSNVAGAFIVPDSAPLTKTHIFLIDDVTTTGATLANAATPLRRAGATVSLIALARS